MGNVQKKMGFKKNDPNGPRQLSRTITEGAVESIQKKGSITKYYDVHYDKVLGRGHYAIVNYGVDKLTGERVAVKRIQINKSRMESLKHEVNILLKVGAHPNIVTLHDIFITDTEVLLVMELLKGGELFDRMVEMGPYSEYEASNQICKIAHALKFLHSKKVVHRDLKPENLILTHKGEGAELKIADFGLSKFVDDIESSTMQTICGTWAYCAPEVRQSVQKFGGQASYTSKVDMWSTGVIMFVMLSAYHPFDPDGVLSDHDLWNRICTGVFDFNDPAWDNISSMAKDLIKHLIVLDPEKRYGPEELLNHPWIKGSTSVPATPITPNIDRSLLMFRKRNHQITHDANAHHFNQVSNFQLQAPPSFQEQNTTISPITTSQPQPQPLAQNNTAQQAYPAAANHLQAPMNNGAATSAPGQSAAEQMALSAIDHQAPFNHDTDLDDDEFEEDTDFDDDYHHTGDDDNDMQEDRHAAMDEVQAPLPPTLLAHDDAAAIFSQQNVPQFDTNAIVHMTPPAYEEDVDMMEE